MLEFHGWATIHESTIKVDESNLRKIADTIQDHIDKLNGGSSSIGLKWVNGTPMFNVTGLRNHRTQDTDDVFEMQNHYKERYYA